MNTMSEAPMLPPVVSYGGNAFVNYLERRVLSDELPWNAAPFESGFGLYSHKDKNNKTVLVICDDYPAADVLARWINKEFAT